MRSNVIQLAERRPAIRPNQAARVAATLDRERDELWDVLMAVMGRAARAETLVACRDCQETVGELLDTLDVVHERAQAARLAHQDESQRWQDTQAEYLLTSALHLAFTKRHLIALGREPLLDALSMLWLRSQQDDSWSLEAALPMILGGPLNLEARADRFRRELRIARGPDGAT